MISADKEIGPFSPDKKSEFADNCIASDWSDRRLQSAAAVTAVSAAWTSCSKKSVIKRTRGILEIEFFFVSAKAKLSPFYKTAPAD